MTFFGASFPVVAMIVAMMTLGPSSARACNFAVASVAAVNGPSYYTDRARSRADPAAKQAYDAAMADFVRFRTQVLRWADAAQYSDGAGRCAAHALHAFARRLGFEPITTPEGQRRRAMLLASLVVAWHKVHTDAEARPYAADINRFFLDQADRAETYFRSVGETPTNRGNLRAFSVLLSAAANAAAGQDQNATRATLSMILCAIGSDGTMPAEAQRGAKAADYHAFAARALAAGVVILGRNGLACLANAEALGAKIARASGLERSEVCGAVRTLAPAVVTDRCRQTIVIDAMVGGRLRPVEQP